jgi:hypothetical protein
VHPTESALQIVPDLDRVASLPMVEEDLGEVCPWRRKNWLPERAVAQGQALGSIEQPWRVEKVESSHEVYNRNPT